MRIITGSARGISLKTLAGEATRPTAEKVKEAIFSAIQFDIEGRAFLDLFAGSGQMGLEALSRGASRATFIDASADAIAVVKENAKKAGFFNESHFLTSDYRNYLRKAKGVDPFDIIFIDPPYADRIGGEAIERILRAGLAKGGATLIVESEEENIFEGREALAERFTLVKKKRYGRTWVTILRLMHEDVLSD
jgi:16S rRNA (guanine(966)-N(2))-methyltransferase RsmD